MEKIVIFGGSGFIGSELIIKLANFKNFQVDVITRNKKTIHPLKVLPNVRFHEVRTFNPGVIERYIRGSEIVINLMGILHEDKKNSFKTIHATYPKIIQNLCIRNKIKKFIHVSALKSESKA
ncbi:MAG: NAD-dependent epimerase/dehydratase family protein, partial [Betaproteobacteria bacterium]|nr:NAD-dependent epimerase/dehydratase family protein [Betaproteobacteria bacterium]